MIEPRELNEVFNNCLYYTYEINKGIPEDAVKARGIINIFYFHPKRLKSYRPEIVNMLKQLPDDFMRTKGGGWTFLNMGLTKNRFQWTTDQRKTEQLLLLGIASQLCTYCLPPNMWGNLPGKVPYFIVEDQKFEENYGNPRT